MSICLLILFLDIISFAGFIVSDVNEIILNIYLLIFFKIHHLKSVKNLRFLLCHHILEYRCGQRGPEGLNVLRFYSINCNIRKNFKNYVLMQIMDDISILHSEKIRFFSYIQFYLTACKRESIILNLFCLA